METRLWTLTWAAGLWLGLVANLPAQIYTFGTLVGNASIVDPEGYPIGDYANGTNSDARFNFPNSVAVDSAGNVFVADTLNNTIRKLTREGTDWTATTVAGSGPTSSGSADGTNGTAQFSIPQAVAVDSGGNLYVADTFNYTIRKITPVRSDWVVSTIAGLAGTSGNADGTNSDARFSTPVSVAVDGATNVYVADYVAHTIRKLTPVGTNWVVSTIAGAYGQPGSDDGTNSQARFRGPGGIAADSAGQVYVSDWENSTIRKITPVGANYVVTTLAGKALHSGWRDGTGDNARFTNPMGGIGVDSAGKLYVTDAGMIRKLRPVGTNWVVTTIAGAYSQTGAVDGTGSDVRFFWAQAVTADRDGNLYVADSNNHTIRMGMPSSVVPPLLQIARAENQVILSWPLSAAGFVLETGGAVPAVTEWLPLTSGVVISGNSYILTNSLGAQNAFYRLSLPY